MEPSVEQPTRLFNSPRRSFRSDPRDTFPLLTYDSEDGTEQDVSHGMEMATIDLDEISRELVHDPTSPHISHETISNTSRRSNSLSFNSPDQASIRSHSSQRKHNTFMKPFRLLSSKYIAWQRQSHYRGWRMGVLFASCMAGVVLCCNIALLIVGCRSGFNSDGVADLMTGESDTITKRNTIFHVLVNVLSTILLAGSNYTMQVLSSPIRKEIDDAHRTGDWLEIGLLSARNMRRISWKRAAMCAALVTSSVPLHLFYNASIFKVLTRNPPDIVAIETQSSHHTLLLENRTQYAHLSNDQWRKTYNKRDVSNYGALYLIVDQIAFNSADYPITFATSKYFPFQFYNNMVAASTNFGKERDWMQYRNGGTPDGITSTSSFAFEHGHILNGTSIFPISIHISHGLATKVTQQSRLQISLHFIIVVIAFNFIKLILMVTALVSDRSHYLVTLGDAAASFLERPDTTTDGKCLMWEGDLRFKWSSKPHGITPASLDSTCNVLDSATNTWEPRKLKLSTSVSLGRSITLFFSATGFFFLILIFCTQVSDAEFEWGSASQTISNISRKGRRSAKDTLFQAWFANTPQLFLSVWYFGVNAVCTSMSSAREWNSFGTKRKGLRVSNPTGRQRSTYFLQLPYRWAIPLMTLSGLLHWLLSQTIFLVRLDYYLANGDFRPDMSKSAVGVSFSSLVVLLAIGFAVMLVVGWVGHRPLDFNVPPAKSCSLVISAACHPPATETDPHLKRVKWGATKQTEMNSGMHCSLSSGRVKEPEIGQVYL